MPLLEQVINAFAASYRPVYEATSVGFMQPNLMPLLHRKTEVLQVRRGAHCRDRHRQGENSRI